MPEYALFCPPSDTSPHVARDFVASVLRALRLDALVDAATLCTSELVTNACVHAKGGGSALWLSADPARVRVTVFDGDENLPVIRELTPDGGELGGRGLHLVDALTDGCWGTAPAAPEGKAVWFYLSAANPGLEA
ncbi:ATP-binding protein [Streptomyces sp. NBC_00243]|uniref:ATP-binding protein n=1 Tax=Streptomyces sp. NBC_00243 TaxID=2975688 RepID=UPI002DD898CA|nr:ATP-binding protein [Streptomyces sp. NBC_00243]WRZ20671.1 ATP-binding protein [Streptomyces sp. NBC_00243]